MENRPENRSRGSPETATAQDRVRATARVVAVQEDLVTIETLPDAQGRRPLVKNEVIHVCPPPAPGGRQERLTGEVLRIRGDTAIAQVFESTHGVGVGDPVEQIGELLSVELGPGLLGQVFDGLQSPLERLAVEHGFFLPRGVGAGRLDRVQKWSFAPQVPVGTRLRAGAIVGSVQEGRLAHRVMVPFDLEGEAEVTWIQAGGVTADTPVARLRDGTGHDRTITLIQRWPVRRPLPESMLRRGLCERLYPTYPLITQQRLIDTFFPLARGGTACIPGPFGAGKTVLQGLIARHSAADIVVLVACGERAGEVVETITEFPRLRDPRTDGTLMDRTVIVCNTSSMPLAAREASLYTGITFAEYYRQMGHHVLLLADSTSRWAQAMRETSGRMEEIPGEEAFPAYLDSAIRAVYERAGVIRMSDSRVGSLTLIGTVSPAGGNFEEPVTQSTLGVVKTFLGLSAERAYKRCYPAVDPLLSWSRYADQLADWYERHVAPGWTGRVREMLDLLRRADGIQQMMQVTGEEGVSLEDYLAWQKAQFVDAVFLQQDAYDEVDGATPISRQRNALELLWRLVSRPATFPDKDAIRAHYIRLTGLFKNLNYAREDSPDHAETLRQIEATGGV